MEDCHVSQEDMENDEESYMRLALQVGQAALEIGEVPVGCIIVLRRDDGDSVVISHGANQVNCTRDATRHAELVAIDRLLTGGQSSDLLRLPSRNDCKIGSRQSPTNLCALIGGAKGIAISGQVGQRTGRSNALEELIWMGYWAHLFRRNISKM